MEVTRVEIVHNNTTTAADSPSVALMHWCIAHGILGRTNYIRIKNACVRHFRQYPKVLDYPINPECREDHALGILFWLRERGDIRSVRFSVIQPGQIEAGNLNDMLVEYDYHQINNDAEWRITYDGQNRLIFPPPDDAWRDFGMSKPVYHDPQLKERAIRNFAKRKAFANYKQQNEPTVTKHGEPIQVFCIHCGMPTEILEEDFIFDSNDKCSQCRALDNRSWLDEAKKFWEQSQKPS